MKYINQIILLFSLFIPCFSHAMSTDLHEAVRYGNLEKVKQLLDRDADVNAVTKDGSTPLYIADINGNLDIFNLLFGPPKARKEQIISFLSATHQHLGENSPANVLPKELFYYIWKLVKPTIEERNAQL